MTFVRSIPLLNNVFGNVRQIVSPTWDDRTEVLKSDVNLFCWQRGENRETVDYLNKLTETTLPAIKSTVDVNSINQKLAAVRKKWDKSLDNQGDAFWTDVEKLAIDFIQLTGKGFGVLHLRMVDDDSCRLFHTDAYRYRLFTTFQGPGTEWLPESAVDRSGLGKNNQSIVKDASQVQRMKSFEVGILKGGLPNQVFGAKGIVHRSPSIKGTGTKRVILRVDV